MSIGDVDLIHFYWFCLGVFVGFMMGIAIAVLNKNDD